ncbi:MAG: hypothetical protein COA47_17840 [Robiginitomaculum sp.]|nr:MAG: hypothetical protein COA47_17840 [Robiginitomaculum sp.]
MDNLTFIQKMIEVLVWPSALVISLIILKEPLLKVIPLISRLKFKDLEIEIAKKEIKELKPINQKTNLVDNNSTIENLNYIKSLAKISTRSAITESWQNLESVMYSEFNLVNAVGRSKGQPYSHVLKELRHSEFIDDSTLKQIRKLRDIRNSVVHLGIEEFSEQDAINYALTCEQIKASFKIAKKVA